MQLQAIERKQPADDQINWVTAFFMAAFHLGAVAALFFFTWKALFVAIFLWWISGSLGQHFERRSGIGAALDCRSAN